MHNLSFSFHVHVTEFSQKNNAIRLEIGTLEKEVVYEQFDELLAARKARFPRFRVDDVFIEYVSAPVNFPFRLIILRALFPL